MSKSSTQIKISDLQSSTSTQSTSKTDSDTDTNADIVDADFEEQTKFTDDRPKCCSCNAYIENWAVLVKEGFWNGTAFEQGKDPIKKYWCQDCHQDQNNREAAAHHTLKDSDRLFNILSASEGSLVADTASVSFAGRGFVRVVDGDPQAINITQVKKEPKVIEHNAVAVQPFEESDFHNMFTPDTDIEDPVTIYLRPVDETPFINWNDMDENQYTLDMAADRNAFIEQ